MMATGDDLFAIKSRVAEPLGIRDGDNAQVELVEKLEKQSMPDVLICDLFSRNIAKSF